MRVSAEGRPVMAGADDALEPRPGEDRAERKPAAERLRDRHDVGDDPRVLEGEHHPRPPEAALDLVADEHGPDAVRRRARRLEEARRERDDPSLAHDGLEEDRGGVGIDGRLERLDVVGRDERRARDERRERSPIGLVAGHGKRAESPPVEALLERDDLRPARVRGGART